MGCPREIQDFENPQVSMLGFDDWIPIGFAKRQLTCMCILYIYCPAFMIVEKVVLYICIFGHHGYSTNIHYWSELDTLRTS